MKKEAKFKETEIGMIPEDWEIGTLSDIATFKNGKKSPERNDSDNFLVWGSNGIIGKSNKTNAEKGITVIGRVGSYCGSVYYSKENAWVTDNAIIAEPKENSDSEFLFYLLKRLNLHQHRGGSGQPLLNQTTLNNIKIALIDKKEQKAIAKILSDLDSKIELLQQQNKTLENIGKTIFKEWFVDFEFPNEEGKPYKSSGEEMIESELGEIPKGWNVSTIYELVEIVFGAPFSSKLFNETGDGLPLIRIRDLKTMKPQFYTVEEHKRGTLIKPGDILAGMDAEFRPRIWAGESSWLNQRVLLARPKKDVVHPFFIYKWVEKPLAFFENSKVGTTVIHLSKSDIDNYEIIIPSDTVLKGFYQTVNNIFKQIVLNNKEQNTLKNQRDLLLPKLMSGKIRVPLEELQ